MYGPPQCPHGMRRKQPLPTNTIYNHVRGDGWILVGQGVHEVTDDGIKITLVLYYTDEKYIETHEVLNSKHNHGVDSLLRCYLDIGAKLGPYEGARPEGNTNYHKQSRAVRMQRHATDIYDTLGHVRGLSETTAVRAAETFGSSWDSKTDPSSWIRRVDSVGEVRAKRITNELS